MRALALVLLVGCVHRPPTQLYTEPVPRVEWSTYTPPVVEGECAAPLVVELGDAVPCLGVVLPVSRAEELDHAEGQRDRLLEAYALQTEGREGDRGRALEAVEQLEEHERALRRDGQVLRVVGPLTTALAFVAGVVIGGW